MELASWIVMWPHFVWWTWLQASTVNFLHKPTTHYKNAVMNLDQKWIPSYKRQLKQKIPPILTTASSNSHNFMLLFYFCSSALSLVARLWWRSTVGSTLAVGIASCRRLCLLCSRETWRWKATLLRVIVLRIVLWLSWLRWVAWSVTGRRCATLLRPRGIP